MLLNVDEFLKRFASGVLRYRGSLLIEGYPGAGKTTLAASICYSYTARNERCLYTTFHEDKEKVFGILSALGIDLASAEKRGFLRYIRFPVSSDVEMIVDELNKHIAEFRPRVVVVDSVNPLLMATETSIARRGYLQNFFASLPEVLNGLLVLVYELPPTGRGIGLEDIEFVVDTIITMKYRIVRGLIERFAEVKKSRGSPLKIAKIPFTISESGGIRFLAPEILEEVPATRLEERKFEIMHPLAKETLSIFRGEVYLIVYPLDARPPELHLMLLAIVIANKARALVISYRYSSEDLRKLFIDIAVDVGIERSRAEEIVDKYLVFRSINPTSHSIPEVFTWEQLLVEELKPDIAVFHGVDVFWYLFRADIDEYYSHLYNQLQYFRRIGVTVVRWMPYISEEYYKLNVSLSDVVHRFYLTAPGRLSLYAWRRGKRPIIFRAEELEKASKALGEFLRTAAL
ncbi:putative RecA ATPase [Ignisphaera aggregans DSM 17230]|uniref:Putative RecA ATPase n=1 Tax=Ignisphaera aggregans (strain DSM 17230 / JCM 13409 / AQ1.S1) TaxID=583356 RepID=E0SSI8_IGNAA|nr:putative RecA ATPase [Ignisphaera aggregans DSM 17230]